MRYNDWDWDMGSLSPSSLNFFTGVGGVLYPAHCFNKEIFNEKVFMNLCPHADDIWFYAMALLNDFTVAKVFTHNPHGYDYHYTNDFFNDSLSKINVINNKNDLQWKNVMEYYNLYTKINKLKDK